MLPEVLAARRRGIVFDVGNGVRDHIRWDIVEQVMRQGFWPDTFSTDWNVMSTHHGRRRFSELHVEAVRLRHVGLGRHRVRHASTRRARSRCSATAAR